MCNRADVKQHREHVSLYVVVVEEAGQRSWWSLLKSRAILYHRMKVQVCADSLHDGALPCMLLGERCE